MIFSEKITVIGAGSWGTSLAILLANKGFSVTLWGHKKNHIEVLKRERQNKKYLFGFCFPESLTLESDIKKSVKGATTIIMVVPSQSCRDTISKISDCIEEETIIISAIKGIEEETLLTMTEVIQSSLLKKCKNNIETGVLSGPSFALEVAQKKPTAFSIGFSKKKVAEKYQKIFGTSFLRVYTSRDIIGLEIAGALKNVVAIATGMCEGLDLGLNARAALITRGLAEMQQLGVHMGAEAKTFSGLSGIGDLLLTCTGNLSRNRQVGFELGKGRSLDNILQEMNMIAEGIKTTKSAYDLAKREGIEMPILEQVYKILYRNGACLDSVQELLTRDLREE